MRKIEIVFFQVLLAFLFLFTSFTPIIAQAPDNIIYPVPPPLTTSYFGQDQSYSVNFRGNGEAVVTMRAVLSNNGDGPLSKVELRVPKVDPKDILVLQVLRQPICMQYEPNTSICVKYQDPSYYDYYSYGAEYRKANVEYSGDTISITLPKEISPNGSGSYLMYYRATGYAKKNLFGGYNFSFETLKANDKIQNLQVGINTDSDIFLKGAGSKVNYRSDESFAAVKSMPVASGIRNSQIDTLYSQIGQGEIYKNVSNLAPLESYTVKGSFADSKIKLFSREILIGSIIVLVFILAIVYALKLVTRKSAEGTKSPNSVNAFIVFGTSLASSLLVFGYTALIYLFSKNFMSVAIFPGNYQLASMFFLLIFIVSAAIYVLFGIVPSIVVGVKRGLIWGVTTFVGTIVWLGVFLVGFLVFAIVVGNSQPNYPIPLTNYDSVQGNTPVSTPAIEKPTPVSQ